MGFFVNNVGNFNIVFEIQKVGYFFKYKSDFRI